MNFAFCSLGRLAVGVRLLLMTLSLAVIIASFAMLDLPTAIVSSLLGLAMLAITVVDARRFIVPDILSLPAIPAGLVAAAWFAPPEFAAVWS